MKCLPLHSATTSFLCSKFIHLALQSHFNRVLLAQELAHDKLTAVKSFFFFGVKSTLMGARWGGLCKCVIASIKDLVF